MLRWSDAHTLRAFAAIFDHAAQECLWLAGEADRRAKAAIGARRRRAEARKQLLLMGARLHVLARRLGSLKAAKAVLRDRLRDHDPVWSLERLGTAAKVWREQREAAGRHYRDIEIWKSRLAGVPAAELAQLHRISTRQVSAICAKIERELRTRGVAR